MGKDVFEHLMKPIIKKILCFQEDTYHPKTAYNFREPRDPRHPPMNYEPAAEGIGVNATMQRHTLGWAEPDYRTQGNPNNGRAGEKPLPGKEGRPGQFWEGDARAKTRDGEEMARPVQERADGSSGWAARPWPLYQHTDITRVLPELCAMVLTGNTL